MGRRGYDLFRMRFLLDGRSPPDHSLIGLPAYRWRPDVVVEPGGGQLVFRPEARRCSGGSITFLVLFPRRLCDSAVFGVFSELFRSMRSSTSDIALWSDGLGW